MSLKINELCVNCDVCEPACPNQAISQGETIYVIDAARCTECVGHFDEPQCVVVCPVECIDPDPEHPEDRESLLAKLRRLQEADGQPPLDARPMQADTPPGSTARSLPDPRHAPRKHNPTEPA